MRRYGVPFEVLTDNGKQFTGRHNRPLPVEVLFERLCRENGITQKHTKSRSPTTTGKIERFHRTLRKELLDHVAPFESLAAPQQAIDAWGHAYNHQRPHQAIDMAVPASLFRPHGPAREQPLPTWVPEESEPGLGLQIDITTPPPASISEGAVEFELRVPPSGDVSLAPGKQRVAVNQGLAGRTQTFWVDLRSVHLLLDGHLVRTVGSRLLPEDLAYLTMRGARPAGPEPATAALPRAKGQDRTRRRPSCRSRSEGSPRRPRLNLGRQVPLALSHRHGRTAPVARRTSRLHATAAASAARRLDTRPAARPRQRPDHGRQAVDQTRAPSRREAGDPLSRAPNPSPDSTSGASAPSRRARQRCPEAITRFTRLIRMA